MRNPVLFGKYLLLERINVGGMAEVFIAKAFGIEGFERVLAVKKILPTMAADHEFITMFIDEARISVQLNHANIVHIHELGRHDDSFYIAMEYVPGPDLRTILDRFRAGNARMPIAQAAYIASRICEGLDYAHRKKDGRGQDLNIIHRDVSPQNCLISYEGEVKIIDFGIAKAANRSHKTQAGILKGKFAYMSPEQVQGRGIDRRSDIFAVGNILFEMLTGERLFVGGSDFSVVEKVRNAEVPSVREIDPEIPPGLEEILMRALAREPAERYQWASEMQEDLLRFQLVGDTIYSSKNLSVFMKEAFAEDLQREQQRMERFTATERPPELEPSGVTQSPFAAPPRSPQPGPVPDLRPGTRRPPRAPEPARATDMGEPSISVDPSIPSFQYLPTDQTSSSGQRRESDPGAKQRRRVEPGEQVEIGDNQKLIDADTMQRPAYASPGPPRLYPVGPAPPASRAQNDEPPPWPSLDGRGETVIQPTLASRSPTGRKEGAGRQPTPKPGPRPVLGLAQPVSTEAGSTFDDEDAEELAARTVADLSLPPDIPSARSGGHADHAPAEPPRPEVPSVTDVAVPKLPPEPDLVTAAGNLRAPLDAHATTESFAIPLPAPSVAPRPEPVPLPAPPRSQDLSSPLGGAAGMDAPDPGIGRVVDRVLPDEHIRSDATSPEVPGVPDGEDQDGPSVTSTAKGRSVVPDQPVGEEYDDPGAFAKTEARGVPMLEEIRRRAAEEDAAESQARTEMRAPQGWAPPAEEPPAREALGDVRYHNTPTEGWEEGQADVGTQTDPEATYGGANSGLRTGPDATGGSDDRAGDEEELPPWPSLEGRGETVVSMVPSPVPRKRGRSLRSGQRGTPATGTAGPRTGNYVVGRMDDSPSELETTAERPRALPPPGDSLPGVESVSAELPAERDDASLPSSRSGSFRSRLMSWPLLFDRRKLVLVGGAAAGVLALVVGLLLALTGGYKEPVWINVSPREAVIRIDARTIPNGDVANLEPGDHDLVVTAPGYRTVKRRLTVSKRTPPVTFQMEAATNPAAPETETGTAARASNPVPAPAGSQEPPPAPRTFVAIFSTGEADVDISVGGKHAGRTPGVEVANLTVGQSYSYVARKPGFRTVTGKVQSHGATEVLVELTMEKATPTSRKAERGALACATRPNGAQIFVDGRPTGRTTPAPPSNPIRLAVGKHKITFKLGSRQVERVVEIKADRMEMLTNVEL